MPKKIIIQPDEHCFIPGKTGSGKTYLGRKFLCRYEYVTVLDTKGTLSWPEVPQKELGIATSLSELSRLPHKKLIYKPCKEEMNLDSYNDFFCWCYDRGNNIVWIDELMGVCPSPFRYPQGLADIYQRGRELNVAAWGMSQRPSQIPAITMTEATHFFVFLLSSFQDRKKVVQWTGQDELINVPGRQSDYLFYYYNVNYEHAIKARMAEERGL